MCQYIFYNFDNLIRAVHWMHATRRHDAWRDASGFSCFLLSCCLNEYIHFIVAYIYSSVLYIIIVVVVIIIIIIIYYIILTLSFQRFLSVAKSNCGSEQSHKQEEIVKKMYLAGMNISNFI